MKLKNRVAKILRRKKKSKNTLPTKPNTYPSLPMKISSLTPRAKNAVVQYLDNTISSLQKQVGALTGKIVTRNKKVRKVPINQFAREFSIGRMTWQNRAAKLQKEINYLEWQRSSWKKAEVNSDEPQLLPQVPEKIFRKLRETNSRTKALVRTPMREYNTTNNSLFPGNMNYNTAKGLYRKMMLKHHPNKGGSVSMFQKVKRDYERYLSEYNIRRSYEEGLKLLTMEPSRQVPLRNILGAISNIVLVGLFLSKKEKLPTYTFESLRLKQITYATTHGIKTHTRRMASILDKIESLGKKESWTVKSMLQGLIGLKKDRKIPHLQKKLRRLNRLIASVRKIKPTFILRRNGQDVLIDQVYLDALVADLMVMKLATETALLDARKAMKTKTNQNIKKIVEEGQLAKNDLMKWFKTFKSSSGGSTGQYGSLLMSTAPVQYMIQSLPSAVAQNNVGEQFVLPQQQGKVVNDAYGVVAGMTTFIALGLLHRIQRRVNRT